MYRLFTFCLTNISNHVIKMCTRGHHPDCVTREASQGPWPNFVIGIIYVQVRNEEVSINNIYINMYMVRTRS